MTDIIDTLKKVRRGAMFIIEAPSGTGKTSVIKKLMELDNFQFQLLHASRVREKKMVSITIISVMKNMMSY